MSQGKRVVLASRPVGEPKPTDFRIEEYAVPTPGAGEVLLRTIWLQSALPIPYSSPIDFCDSPWAALARMSFTSFHVSFE